MLKDKDRIFKNLYGDDSFELSSALKEGDWNATDKILAKGKEWIISEIKNSELRVVVVPVFQQESSGLSLQRMYNQINLTI